MAKFRYVQAALAVVFGIVAEAVAEVETVKWQTAIDAAAAKGGGRVVVPVGWHECGMLVLKSNVELHLRSGAVLAGTGEAKAYGAPGLPRAFICAVGATNVAVTGAGEIFGNAWAWPKDRNPGITGMLFEGCRNVRLEGFLLRDASAWAIHLYHNDGVTVRNVRVDTQACECDDGIDIESKNVLIEYCDVDAGDDAYCLKASDPKFAVENVVVRDCIARSHCNAFKFGTGSAGIMRNVRFERCRAFASRRMYRDVAPMPTDAAGLLDWKPVAGAPWYHCGPGFGAINVECVDGGIVENVLFDDICVEGFQTPIFVRGGRRRGDRNTNGNNDFNILRNVTIRNVRGRADGRTPSTITGVDALRPQSIVLENIRLEIPGEGANDKPFTWPGEELAAKYPQTNMFEAYHLPAYGLFIDKADVTLRDVVFTLRPGTTDARKPVYVVK